jgi:hypothetical protein
MGHYQYPMDKYSRDLASWRFFQQHNEAFLRTSIRCACWARYDPNEAPMSASGTKRTNPPCRADVSY